MSPLPARSLPRRLAAPLGLLLAVAVLGPVASPAADPPPERTPPQSIHLDPRVGPAIAIEAAPPAWNDAQPPEPGSPIARPLPARGTAAQPDPTAASRRSTSWITVFGALGLVLGLFFALAWVLRKSGPPPVARLPREVFDVVGRSQLGPRQPVHLVRFGGKLLLVAQSGAGPVTLAELTDPLEVDRVLGRCQEQRPDSSTRVFRDLLAQLSGDRPAPRRAAGATNPNPAEGLDDPV
jgi:flagellar biogenesis protein FliO